LKKIICYTSCVTSYFTLENDYYVKTKIHWKRLIYSNRTVSNSYRTINKLTVLIEYINQNAIYKQGFIVCASDTIAKNLQELYGNQGIYLGTAQYQWASYAGFWAVQQ